MRHWAVFRGNAAKRIRGKATDFRLALQRLRCGRVPDSCGVREERLKESLAAARRKLRVMSGANKLEEKYAELMKALNATANESATVRDAAFRKFDAPRGLAKDTNE